MVLRMIMSATALLAGGNLVLGAGSATLDDKAKEAAAGMKMGATLNVFRLAAASNADNAVRKWGSAEFTAKWDKVVTPLFNADEKMELHDFFSSAVVWVGPVEGNRAVGAFYNPWSDGLMIVTLKEAGEKSVLEDFQFICGESWRGVADPSAEEVLALYKLKEPLTMAVARLYAPSVERFKRFYPANGKVELMPPDVKALVQPIEGELVMIKTRMMARMKMYQTYFSGENRPTVLAAAQVMKAVKEGDRAKLQSSLTADQDPEMVATVCSLPAHIRTGLGPNYFGKGNDGSILGLVNPAAPRWLIAARVKPGGGVVMELFDLELSERLLRLDKEVK
jgi:hypothetical protein